MFLKRPRAGGSRTSNNTWLAALGVTAVTCGAMAAIASIPGDPQPSGALFWPALWCSLGLLAVPVLGLRNDSAALLRTEHVLMVGLVYWLLLDPLQGAYPLEGVAPDDVVLAFVAIGTMAGGIWIGIAGTGWPLPNVVLRAVRQPLSSKSLFKAVCLTFLLGMFYFAFSSDFDPVTMIDGLGASRFSAPWSRGALGGAEAFVEHLKYFGFVLPSLTVLIARRERWIRPRTVCAAIMSLIMILFLAQDGGRRIIGVAAGAALAAWLLSQERVRPKVLIGGLVAAVSLLAGMELMLAYRSVGFSSLLQASGQDMEISRLHVDDNFLRLSQIVRIFPDVQSYVDLQPMSYALARPIPRFFWSGKPSDPGYDLAALLGLSGVSLTQSIVGELYAMHGLFVVFIGGLVFGRIANMWNKILLVPGGSGKPMIYGLGVMVLLAALRSMQDLIIMSYGLLGWLVIAGFLPDGRAETAVAKPG